MKRSDRTTELLATAFHEAWHGVVSHFYSWPVGTLSIVPGGDGNTGHMRPLVGSLPRVWTPEAARIDASIALVGWLAEAIHGGGTIQVTGHVWRLRPAVDFQRAWARSEFVAVDDQQRDAWLNDLAMETHDLLCRRWHVVERLAAALVERRTMTGKAIREVCRLAE
jgi:hypothetical protein